jgi:hypothetical protein
LVVILDGVVTDLREEAFVVVVVVVAAPLDGRVIVGRDKDEKDMDPGLSAEDNGLKIAAPKKTTEVPKNP